ncbi:MAG TPA: TolC family protein [Anaerohalosphaeraceae bacterium]|nr:TolC family protein [Anaerohalosphaeraceae bacterium]
MVKTLFSFFALPLILLAGCQEQLQVAMPQPRPLGSDYEVFVAPSKPVMEPNDQILFEEPNEDLTLRDVVALTLLHNPELKSYSWEIRAAQARRIQAGLWPNPSLDIGVEDIISGFGVAETTIQLVQLIELGDKTEKRKKVASIDQQLAGWDYETKRLEVLTNASKAYFDLLAAQKKTKLLAELLNISEQTYQSVVRRVDAGKDSPLEKTKASVALSTVRLDHKQALYELDNSRKIVASFWSSEQPQFVQAKGQLEDFTNIPDANKLQQRLSQSPQLARWENQIARGKAALELEKANALPDIGIGGGGRIYNETDDNGFLFGISIPLQIFNRNQGGKKEAAYNISKYYEQQKAARVEVRNQFNRIFTDLSISHDRVKELKTFILPGAEEVFKASQTAYIEGKIDYLNVLDAQRTYFISQTEYLDTLVSYHKAKTDMEGLVGESIDKEFSQINDKKGTEL